jgi:putative transposase
MAYVTRSTGDLLPTCVYTSDGKTFDAEIAHPHHGRPFRPEVTSVVDVATRRCVGFSVGLAENAEGVVDALRYACETHGIPAIFYVDRGSGFKNKRLDEKMTGLMGRLGITKYHSLPQNSQARGIIERFHGSVWNPLSRQYDTYVNNEMDRQARQKSFKVTRKEIREFGSSASLPSFEEFLERCQQAVDAYNAKTHSSLPNRMSPDEYWQSHVDGGFEAVIVTTNESADLFRPYVKRKTRRCLIEYRTNQYFHIGLQEYDDDHVLVGYDIHDASQVWVREIDIVDGEEQGGRLICIAKFSGNEERYIPVTMQRLADEKRAKGRQRRLLDQLVEVEEELNPVRALDHSPMVNVPSFEAPETAPDVNTIIDAEYTNLDATPLTKRGVPTFGSDVELARWALEHPNDLQPNQVAILEDCLTDLSDRQLLIDHGIDVEELTPIIREALGSIQDKRRANS